MTTYYLPSCKFKAGHKETSEKIQAYLRAKEDHVICGCCRVSQGLFKEGDRVLTNCTSCAIITDECSPQTKEISIYEYLLEDKDFKWPDYHGERITVQDCYRSKHKPEMQKAIRECLKRMNMVPVEIEENYEKTMFDGIYRYMPISQSNLTLAPKYFSKMEEEYITVLPEEEQKKEMEKWVSQYTTDRVTVYCNSCLKGVQLGGADGVHILDLIARDL
ncbi:MAG: hypothetical protein IJK53_07570 [Erysipelotrichaceae bacterium]|nr:hypothetical protein [Erysipelotrichaceae bacterium]